MIAYLKVAISKQKSNLTLKLLTIALWNVLVQGIDPLSGENIMHVRPQSKNVTRFKKDIIRKKKEMEEKTYQQKNKKKSPTTNKKKKKS